VFEGEALACVRSDRPVFSGLSFAVGAGEALVLVGPNGAGKTSPLRSMAGLLPPANAHVLIVSRWPDWHGLAAEVEIDVFAPEAAARFLCERAGSDDAVGAARLAVALGLLPLALEQAGRLDEVLPGGQPGPGAVRGKPNLTRRLSSGANTAQTVCRPTDSPRSSERLTAYRPVDRIGATMRKPDSAPANTQKRSQAT